MWRPDHELLARQLTEHFGVEFGGSTLPSSGGYPACALAPVDCAPADAFRISVQTHWRSLELKFEPGAYAADLITQMGKAPSEKRELFRHLAYKCVAAKARVVLSVNGASIPASEIDHWPEDWHRLELVLSKSPANVNTESFKENDEEVASWTKRFVGMVLALVPTEEEARESDSTEDYEGLPEGGLVRVLVNRYERSRINRAACIELQGSICKVCEFDFAATYGDAGNGFINVHHVTRVSEIQEGYRVNPLTDLVPLCANCHAMAHRRNPPFSVEELREMLNRRSDNAADTDF